MNRGACTISKLVKLMTTAIRIGMRVKKTKRISQKPMKK